MRTSGLMHAGSGFTLIELSLSIAFISVLSIIIVVLINGTISSYNRGLTLNKINTGGMDLVDELRTAIQSSKDGSALDECDKYDTDKTYDKCKRDGAKLFVSVVRSEDIYLGSTKMSSIPVYGAFCTGRYSYLWNSGYFSSKNDYKISEKGDFKAAVLKYKNNEEKVVTLDGSGESGDNVEGGGYVRLLKIADDKRAVCASKVSEDYEPDWSSGEFDISDTLAMNGEPEEILSSDGHNELAVFYLDAAIPAESKQSKDIFYSVSMILGTTNGGIDLSKGGDFCATPGQALENMDFCAVNKFNFAVQANGL